MKLNIVFLLFIFSLNLKLNAQNFKGLYIDGFHQILGNQSKEDSLFDYLRTNNFNSISLYNLHLLDFNSSTQMNQLKSFISTAKNQHQISQIGATAENAWFFENKILPYNLSGTSDEQFNVFNLEFEFWVPSAVSGYYCTTYLQPGGFTCDENGAFEFYMQELTTIKNITSVNGWSTEIYLGWFNQNQANQVKTQTDRILLSNYQSNPSNCFDVSLQRLQYLGNSSPVVNVVGLFSSETDFLNNWLNNNDNNLDSAYSIYKNEFELNTGSWKNNINLIGHQWFTYSTMNYELGTAELKILGEGNLTIYPNPAKDIIQIRNFPKEKIILYNMQLKEVANFNLLDEKINIENLPNGIYYIKLGNKVDKIIKVSP